MDVVVTIVEYKNQLKARGYAPASIESYGKGLDLFSRYLQAQGIDDLRKVTKQTLFDYQSKIMEETIAQESKALKIRPVKRLFEYLIENNHLLINPAEGIVETNRTNRKIGSTLTLAEMQKLLQTPNLSVRTGIRDKAVMELLYCTGIRRDELLNLDIYDADLKDHALYIRKAKGRKQRVVPLGNTASKYLKEYLEKIRPHHAKKNPKEKTLFKHIRLAADSRGAPCRNQSVQADCRDQEAGISAHFPQELCHAFNAARGGCALHPEAVRS